MPFTDPISGLDPDVEAPALGAADAATAELLRRKDKLERQVRVLRKLHRVLLKEAAKTEKRLQELTERIGALDAVVDRELRGREDGPGWEHLQVHEAVAALLQEAGGYLTDSQICRGLTAHGVPVDNTEILRLEMHNAAAKGAPLVRVSERHWGHRDWAHERRGSREDLYKGELN